MSSSRQLKSPLRAKLDVTASMVSDLWMMPLFLKELKMAARCTRAAVSTHEKTWREPECLSLPLLPMQDLYSCMNSLQETGGRGGSEIFLHLQGNGKRYFPGLQG